KKLGSGVAYNAFDLEYQNLLNDYLYSGGFPEVVLTSIDKNIYLSTMFDSIILRDIVNRYNVRSSVDLSQLAKYLITNFTKEFSYTKLANSLGFTSVNTVISYVNYIEETYLLQTVSRFSQKVKEQMNAPKKIYCVDNGFIDAQTMQNLDPKGKLIENLVFVELLRRGLQPNLTLFYYKTKNEKEIDFVARSGYEVSALYQATFSIANVETKKREISALLEASAELNCNNLNVITWQEEAVEIVDGKEIKFIPLAKFLLNEK
ncbi:MAG: ATP-binding protein, partial [archaeon]